MEEGGTRENKMHFTLSLRTSDGMVLWLYLQIRNY